MIKKIKGSLFIKVFITTAILLTGVSFLVYLILAWYTPKTYSNTLNATLDEQTKIFISEISQMPMEETGGIFDNFLDYQNVDRMELFEENGNRINLPTERSADNDVGAAGQVAELQRAFQKVFPLLAFIVFCVSLVTGWIFSHLITKPVLKISRISKEMSELQFEWQLDEQRTDELGILAKSLNYLSQKLNVTLNDLQAANRKLELDIEHEKALEQARTNFFSAVSHELKTPITIIKGQLEGMLLGIGPYKDHERYLTRSLEITNTLETMVQDILTISRLETAGADFKKDHLDCVQIIKAYLNETADLIAEKDLQIHLDILPSAFINGNKMLVEKVFSNLIGNAIKYSPQRADIWISVLMKHEQIVFSVENAGVHIPENSIPRLFDAFYRVEQSRSRKTGGSGLGLYIVQEILHQYGSECTVCNTQAGVKFSFII